MPLQPPSSTKSQTIANSPLYAATMAPMVRKTRTEVSITYVSADWNELANLLTAPAEFIQSLEFLWLQDTDRAGQEVDYCAWQMISPIVAIVEPIGASVPKALRTISDIQAYVRLIPDSFFPQYEVLQGLLTNPEALAAKMFSDTDSFINTFGGIWVLKFALYTSTINITYIPPAQPRKSYDFDLLSSVSLIASNPPAQNQLIGMDVHFDISPSPRQVANFIFNHIQNTQWIADYFTSLSATPNTVVLTETRAVPPMNVVNNAFFQAQQFLNNATFSNVSNVRPEPWDKYARITAQGLSSVGFSNVCGHMTAISTSTGDSAASLTNGKIVIGNLVIQTYACPHDPKQLLNDITRV